MRKLYELHKAFAFRTLWEASNPLASFQRVASESALGTGRLNGAVQLTKVFDEMKAKKEKYQACSQKHTKEVKKWTFDKYTNKAVSFSGRVGKGRIGRR